jgi:hypothetical protein
VDKVVKVWRKDGQEEWVLIHVEVQSQEAHKVAVLEAGAKPFAAVVLAHLKTQETHKDPLGRLEWKKRIVKGLYERGWLAKDVRQLWHFIDWMMDLPKALEDQVGQEIERYEQEKQMP